jgi:ABC-type nitrate/sulfonate/bicarbonate transport system substrate-binding protein
MEHLSIPGFLRRSSFLVAVHKGFFAREELEVDFQLIKLAPEHNREMAEGRRLMSMIAIDTMLARATKDSVDFVAFMQTEQGMDVQLVVRPEIKSFADLRGKLFAADPVDSNFDLVRNKIMRDHGITEDEYRIEVIGNSYLRLAALQEGRVSAAMLAPPSTDRAVAGAGVILAEGADHISDWPITCGWGLRRLVAANRSTIVRYIRASVAATDWLLEPGNREETLRLLMQEEKLSRPRAEKAYTQVVPKCALNTEAVRKNIELRIELGYYKPPHKPAEAFYDSSYWCEATGLPAHEPVGYPRNAVLED